MDSGNRAGVVENAHMFGSCTAALREVLPAIEARLPPFVPISIRMLALAIVL